MPNLLSRELTAEERVFEVLLRRLLSQERRLARSSIRDLAARNPGSFLVAGLAILDSEEQGLGRRRVYGQLVECPEFLAELVNPERFSEADFLTLCRRLKQIDDFLDVRLARLVPGRHEDEHELPPPVVVRLLNVLHAISPGPRLVQVLSHLTHHPEERVASKATMVMGHRIRSDNWLRNQFQSTNARVRASVVEGLWGVDTPLARRCMRDSLQDSNNRVVGNALVGLHLLGDPTVDKDVVEMLGHSRAEFRRTAAWVMGRIGKPEFSQALEKAAQDEDAGVRMMARRVLEAIRPTPVEEQVALPDEDKKATEISGGRETVVAAKPAMSLEPAAAPSKPKPALSPAPAGPEKQESEPQDETPPKPAYIPVPHFDGKYIRGL